MQLLRKPYWVFLLNTGPLALLLALGWGTFSVIRTLLPPESLVLWQQAGLGVAGLLLASGGWAAVQAGRRQLLGAAYALASLLVYTGLLYLMMSQTNALVPFDVPRWMVPTDPVLMAWTLAMPTLAHALLVLVARFAPDDRPAPAWPSMLLALAIPGGWFVLTWAGQLWRGWRDWGNNPVLTTCLISAFIAATLAFFFFLVRALYLLLRHQHGLWDGSAITLKIVVSGVLPLLGLAVNNGLFYTHTVGVNQGIFGDFTSPWFYGLAALNGLLLCLPNGQRPGLRLLLFAGRSLLLGYTLYFLLVFLPFLPLALPAIVLIGVGFLLLTPPLLFVLHLRQLTDDWAALRPHYGRPTVLATLLLGLAGLPLAITASYWHSRRVLHEALAYVYAPNYAQTNTLDTSALTHVLAVVRNHKSRDDGFFGLGNQQPYLSTYFNWLVLDNLMLSESKSADLEHIFTGAYVRHDGQAGQFSSGPLAPPAPDAANGRTTRPAAPVLRRLGASSRYDTATQTWTSRLRLDIANPDSSIRNAQYATTFALPSGCWVSDYTLTIGPRAEHGILAEKRAAAWVFAQIVGENHDPGLLTYAGPNALILRVFPVSANAVRHTEIELLHREPCRLTIDGRTVDLGTADVAPPVLAPVFTPDGRVGYLSAAVKRTLPLVRRRPYYHFLLDAGGNGPAPAARVAAFRARVARQLAQPLPGGGSPPRFSLVNSYCTTLPVGQDWAAALGGQPPGQGGCYLSGAIRRVLFEAQRVPRADFPVLVVVSADFENTVLDADFEDFSSAYPEGDRFYVLPATGPAEAHSLRHQSRRALAPGPVASGPAPTADAPAVRAWPDAAHARAYLPDDAAPAIVLRQPPLAQPAKPTNRWLAGLALRGYTQWQTFHPETTDCERVPFIQASFRAGLLTPFTSFLALENEAQKAALRRKQAETLAANAALDTLESDDDAPPTETPIDGGTGLLLLAGLALAGWRLRRNFWAPVAG